MGRRGNIVNIQATEDGINYSTLSHTGPHETTRECGCLERHFIRTTLRIGRGGFHKVRGKIIDYWLLEETVDLQRTESLSHIQEYRAYKLLLLNVLGHLSNEGLDCCVWVEAKLLIVQKPASVYFT